MAVLLAQLGERPALCGPPANSIVLTGSQRFSRAQRAAQQATRATATATAPPAIDLSRQPLSTYALPLRQPRMVTWLENCIKDAVRNLEQAPFVQLYLPGQRADTIKRHQVTNDFVQAPQVWHAIAEHLAHAMPEVLVLVHPIHLVRDSAQQAASRQLKRKKAHTDVLTGITAQQTRRRPRQLRPQDLESLIDNGVAHEQFSGRVGEDCCEDEGYSQSVPFSGPASNQHGVLGDSQVSWQEGSVQYHGVVVQSAQDVSAIQGCYVLKTVQSQSLDCTCTSYTLTRVSRGQPLAEQLAASWLC